MFCWMVNRVNRRPDDSCSVAAVQHNVYAFRRFSPCHCVEVTAYVFNTLCSRWREFTSVTTGICHCSFWIYQYTYPEGHTAVLIEHVAYIWGGRPPHSNVLHAFDVDTHSWSKPRVSGTVPEGRQYHSACVLGKVMFIHGGHCERTGLTNDTYRLDTSKMVWSLINTRGNTPPASAQHSANIIGTKMFVFGGRGHYINVNHYNSIRVFDTETNFWLDTPPAELCPGSHSLHAAAFAYNGELYVIVVDKSALWRFNPETFSWTKVESKGKGPSMTSSMCCCMVGDRIILFEGVDLHILDLSPSLKTLCKKSVIQYGLEHSPELPHDIRWELRPLTTKNNGTLPGILF